MNKERLHNSMDVSYILNRAQDHKRDILSRLNKTPPFPAYVITDTAKRERWIQIQTDEEALSSILAIFGDFIYNLRKSLDVAYFNVVSKYCPKEFHRNIQFPFSKDAKEFESQLKGRKAYCVPDGFADSIKRLQPYKGGNVYLFMVHDLRNKDFHRGIVSFDPNFILNSEDIFDSLPDLCQYAKFENLSSINVARVVSWPFDQSLCLDIGHIVPPSLHMYKKRLCISALPVIFAEEKGYVPLDHFLNESYLSIQNAVNIINSYL